MTSITGELFGKDLIAPPPFLLDGLHYETVAGSIAYGTATPESDHDVYGFTIPPKDVVFPHLRGEIPGFGRQIQRFEQFQKHHIKFDDKYEVDLTIYNIVKFFHLCMENNPNMIDTLFTPEFCISHCTNIGEMVRDNRKLFLHKGSWHRFKGFAHSQMHKLRHRKNRKDLIHEHSYDVKYAMHAVRLIYEAKMILEEGDIHIQRHKEELRDVRNGLWTLEQVETWIANMVAELDKTYGSSDAVPHSPNTGKIKELLLNCLEEHYGNL